MKKDVNIVSSMCGKGLEREYLLLKALFAAHDVYTVGIHYTNYAGAALVRADVNIFLEVVMPNVFNLSRENWLVPNCEWWNPINDRFLPLFTKVLCKTKDCFRIWSAKVGENNCVFTGFEARDLYKPGVPRENKFLHVAGESEFKNTESVINAWRSSNWSYKPFPLTVITRQRKYQELCQNVEGVTCLSRVTDDELVELMNSHRFHLLPSAYEGFGHALNEGLGCGALVITTAAPPMSEFEGVVSNWKVPVINKTARSLAQLAHVSPVGVMVAACKAISAADNVPELECRSRQARESFLSSRELFRKKILALVGVS